MFLSAPLRRTMVAAALGLGMLATPASASAVAAPAAPTSLTASSGPGTVVLAWTDAASDETGFSIERCLGTSCTAFGQIGTVGADATSYSDMYSASGVSRYRVRAFNAVGYSTYSNIAEMVLFSTGEVFPSISATPTTGMAPLTVSFDGSASTALNGPISNYQWSFGDDQTASGAVVTHTYTSPGVYAATLRTTAGPFNAAEATAVIITVATPPLVAPGDLSANSSVRGQIRLTWTNPISSATSLTLERCKGSGCTSFTRIAALTTSSTTFVDCTVKRRTTYRYRLAASSPTATAYSNIVVAVAG